MTIVKPQQFQVTIEQKKQLTKTVFLFGLRLFNGQQLHFAAGQYVAFIIDDKTRRQYSFASAPNNPTTFEIVIDTLPMGPGSKFFIEKNVGDTTPCIAPLGTFIMDKTTHRRKVMIATGTGVAPLRSMILDGLRSDGPKVMNDELILYWGLRHEEDVYWANEFDALARERPNFRFFICLSQPTDAWQDSVSRRCGRVTNHLAQDERNLKDSDIYLCGSREMTGDIERQCIEFGVPPEQIHKELYF